MLRSVNKLAVPESDKLIGSDLNYYSFLKSGSKKETLKNILWFGIADHFNVATPELVYYQPDKNHYNLYIKLEKEYQSIDYWDMHRWTKFDLRYILDPYQIIHHYLIELFMGELMPGWKWVWEKGTKDQLAWLPGKQEEAAFAYRILKKWLPLMEIDIIFEKVENFFSLVDYKVNDIILFSMASFMELWENDKNLNEEWCNYIMDISRIESIKEQSHWYILQNLKK